jgi:hypothetical protein
MSEAVAEAGVGEGMTKMKRSPPGNTMGKAVPEPAAPAAGFEPTEPERWPIPIVRPIYVIGGVGVARQHTAIVRIEVEAWIAGIRDGMRLHS